MWVFTNDGFYSIVRHRTLPNMLIVRARFKGDIEKLIPDAEVIELNESDADYRFRAFVDDSVLAKVFFDKIEKIDYPNFKNSISIKGLHAVAIQVWSILKKAQILQRPNHS